MGKNTPALGNFNAGELSPDFAGRVDNEKYAVGCDTLQNFIPRVQGPARRRPGSRFVQPVKSSGNRVWLRRFIFSQAQAYQVEFGPGYIRFYTNHGQVQVSGVSAWSSVTAYPIGALVSQGGINYYCTTANTNQSPPNASFWYALSGTIYEIPSPYTAGMLTNGDGACGLQLEQSGDVLYIACAGYWPMTLTRFGSTNWQLAIYAPPDGPFIDQNSSNTPALWVEKISGSPNQVTCFASAAIFDPSDVAGFTPGSPGRLIRIDVQYFNTQTWAENVANSVNGVHVAGDFVRWNGNTYQALNAGVSGPNAPVHTQGTAWDGNGNGTATGVQWLYLDSGYGIGAVTTYASPTQVTLTLSMYGGQSGKTAGNQYYRFPNDTIGVVSTISAITAANPPVVQTSAVHGYKVGDPVYLTGVGGMTQISEQMYVITAIPDTTHFTLGTVDASGYSAFTSGGTAVKNASLRWQIGAWGIGSSAFAGTFPSSLAFYSDRLFWAGGITWWGSAPGQYASHTQDIFSLITDAAAITGIIAAQDVDSITWMSPLLVLLIGTKGGEFGLSPIVTTQPLGPNNVAVNRFSKLRSRQIAAQIIGTSNFYVQQSGKKVMAQDYNFWLQIYESTNQTRLANHIAGYSITSGIIDTAYHSEPYESLWAVRSDGVLIGYVFDKQDNVTGWHEHLIGGTVAGPAVVESVSVIPAPDGTRDEAWLIVRRTIGGQVIRSIEYLEKDYETGDVQNTMCYVDMSGTYNGAPTTTISGLTYLNGESVSVVRDGGGHPDCIVVGGSITLSVAGSVVQVGLKCPANLITMRPEGGADVGTAQGKTKRANQLTVRLKNTLGGSAGIAGLPLDLLQPNVNTTNLGSPPPLTTGDVPISLNGDYQSDCKIQIQQNQPFQMEVLGIFPVITVNEPSPQ